jgi:hypothetical protein
MNDLTNVKPLTNTEAAYIAGFLDADGCFVLQVKQRKNNSNRYPIHFHPVMTFANNRIKVLYWIQRKCGGFGNLSEKGKSKKQDRSYTLLFSSSVIRWILPQIIPFLILKRKQAELLLEYCTMTNKIRGGKIKSDLWFTNFKRYFQIYLHIRCLNNDISYGMYFNKLGELLERPESQSHDNVIREDERERIKRTLDWIISSQAYRNCMQLVGRKVQRLECEETITNNHSLAPDPKGKI